MATAQKYTKRDKQYRRVKYFFYTLEGIKILKQKSFKSPKDAKEFEQLAEIIEYRTKSGKYTTDDVKEWLRNGIIKESERQLLIKATNLITLDEAIHNYLSTVETSQREKTNISYRVEHIREFFDCNRLVSSFIEDDGDNFRSFLKNKKNYATEYINKHLRTLVNIFNRQWKKQVITVNPFFDIKKAPRTAKERAGKGYYFTPDEVCYVLKKAKEKDSGKSNNIARLTPKQIPPGKGKKIIPYEGEFITIKQAAAISGASYQTIYKRIQIGVSPEKLLMTPSEAVQRPLLGGNLYFLLLFGFGTGGRRSELQLSQYRDINFKTRTMIFSQRVKGGEPRAVGLGLRLFNEIEQRYISSGKDPEAHILPRYDKHTITDVCSQFFTECGFPATCHSMRHTYITNIRKIGKLSIYESLKRAGHKDEKTLNIYTHFDLEVGSIIEDSFTFMQEK